MLTVYDAADGVLIKREAPAAITSGTVWIDLLNPTKDEDLLVEQALAISVPTREEMAEIEASSRLYQEGGAHYMTAVVLHQPDVPNEPADRHAHHVHPCRPPAGHGALRRAARRSDLPRPRAEEGCRLHDRRGGDGGLARGHHRPRGGPGGAHPGRGRQAVANHLRRPRAASGRARCRFDVNIRVIGREGELTSRSRECLLTLDRLLTYLGHVMSERGDDKALRRA